MNAITNKVVTEMELLSSPLRTELEQFSDEYGCYDTKFVNIFDYCDTTKIRKNFNIKGRDIKIEKVYVSNTNSPTHKNIQNKLIPLKMCIFCNKEDDGAYRHDSGMWVKDYPCGDAIIVIKKK